MTGNGKSIAPINMVMTGGCFMIVLPTWLLYHPNSKWFVETDTAPAVEICPPISTGGNLARKEEETSVRGIAGAQRTRIFMTKIVGYSRPDFLSISIGKENQVLVNIT